jgi:hypothetical protein
VKGGCCLYACSLCVHATPAAAAVQGLAASCNNPLHFQQPTSTVVASTSTCWMADRNTPGLGLARPTQQMACSSPQYSTGTSPLVQQQQRSNTVVRAGCEGVQVVCDAEHTAANTGTATACRYMQKLMLHEGSCLSKPTLGAASVPLQEDYILHAAQPSAPANCHAEVRWCYSCSCCCCNQAMNVLVRLSAVITVNCCNKWPLCSPAVVSPQEE